MTDACTLCDLPTPDPPVTAEGVPGGFCCRGCLEVARTLDDPAGTSAEAARDAATDDADGDWTDGDGETAYLRVDGMHCASCEAFLEGRATAAEGVSRAAASYPADAMRVQYDPATTTPAAVADAVGGVGYRAVPGDEETAFDESETVGRLLVGGFFAMMVMVWYALFLYPTYFGLPPEALLFDLRGDAGLFLLANVWVLSTVVLGYTGAPLLRGAYVAVRTGRPNMDLLVALAATTAYCYSAVAVALGRVEVYFDVTVVVVLAVTVGSYYERRVKRSALGRLTDLTRDRVGEARVLRGDDGEPGSEGVEDATAGSTERVPVASVAAGDRVVVRAGERVPVDGRVVRGEAAVDESLVTGESLPVRREPDDPLRGGTLVTDGRVVLAAADADDRTLDRVRSLLWGARAASAPQRLADALATVFVPVVLALGTLAFLAHLALGAAPTAALLTGLAVLVVSCPCALGLATPLAVAAGTRALLDEGVVLADGDAVESVPVDNVALDKTGTLTTGAMVVTDVVTADGVSEATLLGRAAAVEARSDHPVADAVVAAYRERVAAERDARRDHRRERDRGPDATVADLETHPSRGVSGRVGGQRVTVGGASLFETATVPAALRERHDTAERRGALAAYVGWDGQVRGVIVAGDEPRERWRGAVRALGDGRRVVVLSGDEGPAVERFADAPGVDAVHGGLPPAAKAAVVERLATSGRVAMVGDGSNDAPALAAADLGIAVATGTELAADAADAVLVGDDLRGLARALSVLGRTRRRVRENLAWALCYNAVAVPAAVVGAVSPLLAAAAMAASSLLVVGNSARSLRPGDDDSRDGDRSAAGTRPTAGRPATDGGRSRAEGGGDGA